VLAELRCRRARSSIYALALAGLAYSLLPCPIIDRITIREAAAHPSSLGVVLAGALAALPFIVACPAYSYRVFRGKASAKLSTALENCDTALNPFMPAMPGHSISVVLDFRAVAT